MQKIVYVFDDLALVNNEIAQLIGSRSFGSILKKNKKILDQVHDIVTEHFPQIEFIELKSLDQQVSANYVVFHQSHLAILNQEHFVSALRKVIASGRPCCYEGIEGLPWEGTQALSEVSRAVLEPVASTGGVLDISNIQDFLSFMSAGTKARHFNHIKSDELTLTKSSTDRKKLRAEFEFYNLLPEPMKIWFAQPFSWEEEGDVASYSMEKFRMADMALQWIHGGIDEQDFRGFLDRFFLFLKQRPKDAGSDGQREGESLYFSKVRSRLTRFCQSNEFERIDQYIKSGTRYRGVGEIFEHYEDVYMSEDKPFFAAISHGDACLSNIIYDKRTRFFRFIDPKGALSKSDLFLEGHYDLAKMAHSILGGYDFINNELFRIQVGEKNGLRVEYSRRPNLAHIFYDYVKAQGYSIRLLRLLEVSLFLSMLPLHMDYPQKGLAFLLNAIDILDQIE